ncbi:hypothetical protein H5410_001065 [Solanum commersonii]|uniref:Uncharacterized protein n=1 Tax=Solanum commersonii TaxID=4109 RepID=A0A9J6AY23_SOLCO|nr:hypothetical protein H5410_001065 [Solanum commersonii]
MPKKLIKTPQKSPRLGEGTSNDDAYVLNFNILTQPAAPPPPPKIIENPANIQNPTRMVIYVEGATKREKMKKKKGHPYKSKGEEEEGKNC